MASLFSAHAYEGRSVKIALEQVRQGSNANVIIQWLTNCREQVAPVNLFLQSLFSQISVYLQNQLLSSTNNHYAYKSMMKTLLNYGNHAKNSQLTSQLFYKDMAEDNYGMEITGINTGLGSRATFIEGSKELTMSGPLYEDVFGMNRHLINGKDLTLKLYRSPSFCLMSGADVLEYTIELLDAYLKVCKLKVNQALTLTHNTLFQNNSNTLYPFTKSEVKVNSIPKSYPIANHYIIRFVESATLNGKYDGNPFNFQSFMLKTVSLYVNGVSVPGRPTRVDDVDSYVNMFDGMGLWRKNVGNQISRGHALFVFELYQLEEEYLNP